jgi:hypothetical protein
LAPLAYARLREALPAVAARLGPWALPGAAANLLHFNELSSVLDALAEASISVVVLKGAALASAAYGGIAHRPMDDVDLWIRDEEMDQAASVMHDLGFEQRTKDVRPVTLQRLSRGELQFVRRSLIELHWSPFPGWWITRTAAIDEEAVWRRAEPLAIERPPGGAETAGPVLQLSPEDALIELAVHLAVNHQFGLAPLRSLLDIALTARSRAVDWPALVARARGWRVANAVWTVLDLAHDLVGLKGAEEALQRMRPGALHRRLIRLLVSPVTMVAGRDLRHSPVRNLLLLLLIDRTRDAFLLLFRAVWPERAWLQARYGTANSRWRHVSGIVRRGEV